MARLDGPNFNFFHSAGHPLPIIQLGAAKDRLGKGRRYDFILKQSFLRKNKRTVPQVIFLTWGTPSIFSP